jgi:hypothetical protein
MKLISAYQNIHHQTSFSEPNISPWAYTWKVKPNISPDGLVFGGAYTRKNPVLARKLKNLLVRSTKGTTTTAASWLPQKKVNIVRRWMLYRGELGSNCAIFQIWSLQNATSCNNKFQRIIAFQVQESLWAFWLLFGGMRGGDTTPLKWKTNYI